MTTIHRVVVRGHFDGLRPDQRARLLDEAPQHDLFRSAFTADGCFTYDERLVAKYGGETALERLRNGEKRHRSAAVDVQNN